MLLLRHCQDPVVFRLERLIRNPVEGNAWHADHILAVADGGGEPFRKQLTFGHLPIMFKFYREFSRSIYDGFHAISNFGSESIVSEIPEDSARI